jgi:hypothetical protein
MYSVSCHRQVLKQEFGGIRVISKNAADFRSRKDHHVRTLSLKELLHGQLIGQIQFTPSAGNDSLVTALPQQSHDSGTNHTVVTGNIN